MKILITCPPMLRSFEHFQQQICRLGYEVETPEIVQVLSEETLMEKVPQCEGWILGDDPATARVFEAGKRGCLRAVVKWGVGTDNVDREACQRLGLSFAHTPHMFGKEVADLAVGYVVALARGLVSIDVGVKGGEWPKPVGISLAGKTVALVGLGDIGRNTAKRLLAAEMNLLAYDPGFSSPLRLPGLEEIPLLAWPEGLEKADFLVLTCALNPSNYHLVNEAILARCKAGIRIVNVARGPLIDERALVAALHRGQVAGAALEVFEQEPLPLESPLRSFPHCLFGSHNASNTLEAVCRTSERAIQLLHGFLQEVRA